MSAASIQPRAQAGTTLIELVVAITIIAIAVLSVMSLFAATATQSGEALIREQATAIACAYLDEITAKPFTDVNTDGETARANFDDVDDYSGVNDVGARNAQDLALAGLESFTVTVVITHTALAAIAAADVMRIDVTVRHSTGSSVMLSGYRFRGVP